MPKKRSAREKNDGTQSKRKWWIRPLTLLTLLLLPALIIWSQRSTISHAEISASTATIYFGPQIVIDGTATDARSVHAADLDNDGDFDVVTAARGQDQIGWHENLNSKGAFGSVNEIESTQFSDPYSVATADLDDDGDLDVLAALGGWDEVVWYENRFIPTGNVTFAAKEIINTPASAGAIFVTVGDMDGDDDPDVLVAHQGNSAGNWDGSKIAWYENRLADGLAWTTHIVDGSVTRAQSVFAADVDGDDDLDFLAALSELKDGTGDNKIVWYKNLDGNGNLGTENVIAVVDFAVFVTAVDINNDAKIDVLSSSSDDHKITWHENTAGDGTAWTDHTIDSFPDTIQPDSLVAKDLDNDNDPDLIVAAFLVDLPLTDSRITVYENTDGQGTFALAQVVVTEPDIQAPQALDTADLDGDGFLDLLSASSDDNKIAWYKSPPFFTYLPTLMNNYCPPFTGTNEREPNDTAEEASGCLVSGVTYSGNSDEYGSNADNDFFYIYLPTAGTITIDVTNFLSKGQLLLYDGSTAVPPVTFIADQADGRYYLTHNGDPGLYYIRLVSLDGHSVGIGDYSLKVTYP